MITVYAASAFVILELVDIITEPFGLPGWTLKFVVVILSVGLIVAIILSWIYDIHPEEGMVKTEPADKVKTEDAPKSSNSWKIASYISFVVIMGLIALNIISRTSKETVSGVLDKSIAVLPFRNDSPDQENEYFINGYMESVLNNLCKIKDLRVISRSSVERYRDSTVRIPDVAKEQIVSYVLEGSMQKYGNHIRLTLQLIDKNDNHVWGEQYDREVTRAEEHLLLQSEIAQLVAQELEALITPNEKELIEHIPTTNLTAYDLYLLGNEYRITRTEESLLKAIEFYESAIALDPQFAQAYIGIAYSYRYLFWPVGWLPEEVYEKSREAVQKALEIDDQLDEAHALLGLIHYEYDWDLNAAEQELIKAIELNPNYAFGYFLMWDLYVAYGSYMEAHRCIKQAIMLDPTNERYHQDLGVNYYFIGEVDSAINYLEERDTSRFLGQLYLEIGEYEKSIEIFKELERESGLDLISRMTLGIAYARVGMNDKTRELLEEFINSEEEGTSFSFYKAALLAELGEPDSAIFWLRKAYDERNQVIFYIRSFNTWFSSLRYDPRLVEILNSIYPEENDR